MQWQVWAYLFKTGKNLYQDSLLKHKLAREIRDTPTSKIDTAAQGTVEFQGYAWPIESAAYSSHGDAVVYHEFKLERFRRYHSWKSNNNWETVFTTTKADPFYIVDATGLAIVHPDKAIVSSAQEKTSSWFWLSREQKEHIKNNVVTTPIDHFPPWDGFLSLFSERFRVTEKTITVGSPLYVKGRFTAFSNAEPQKVESMGLTYFYNKVFCSDRRSQKNLTPQLDKNKDGLVSEKELAEGAKNLVQLALVNSLSSEERSFLVHGIVKGEDKAPLVLGDTHQDYLIHRLERFQKIKLAAGAACFAFLVLITTNTSKNNTKLTKTQQSQAQSNSLSAAPLALQEDPRELHFSCVQGNSKSCHKLVVRQDILRLSPEHIKYYESRALQLEKENAIKRYKVSIPPRSTTNE